MSGNQDQRASLTWGAVLTVLVLLIASVLMLYRETATAMVSIWWRSETFAHAFTVPPIVAWLIWRQRHALTAQAPQASAWALLPIGAAGLVWLLGDLAAANAVTQLAFTALLVAVAVAVLGLRAARTIAFPLAFLFFAVPVGEFMLPQLMQWTADFTIGALRLSGIPVLREGLQFVIPSGSWSVVEACSGVRYLIASFMVGTLFAYLTYQSTKRRLIFMLISIVVPLVANWVRAYLIVMLGHLSGNTIAVGADHLIYGWVFFGIVIFLLFLIGSRWAEPEQPLSVPASAPQTSSVLLAASERWVLALVAVAAVALAALPPAAQRAIATSQAIGSPTLAAPATLAPGWQATASPPSDWNALVENPSAEIKAAYARGGRTVGLYVGYFRQQDYEHKLAGAENVLVSSNAKLWLRIANGTRQLDVQGRSLTVRTAELRSAREDAPSEQPNLVFWQTYWIDGSFTTSEYAAKARVALNSLVGRGDDAAVIVLYAPKTAPGEAEATLEAFVQANLSVIDALLQQTRSQP